jgi:hypothetical protein
MNGANLMDDPFGRSIDPDPPVRLARGACLVAGCTCKDPRIISPRRVAFFAHWARDHGETADRRVDADEDSRVLLRPWRDRLFGRPDRPGLAGLTNVPSPADRPGW